MSRYRKLTLISCATALAFGLAACSSSDKTAAVDPEPEPTQTPQEMCEGAAGEWRNGACVTAEELMAERAAAQTMAITDAISAANTAVAAVNNDSAASTVTAAEAAVAAVRAAIADAADVADDVKAAHTGTADAIAGRLAAAKTARQMAMDAAQDAADKAMMATAKKLHAGIVARNTSDGASERNAEYAGTNDANIMVTIGTGEGNETTLTENKKATVADNHGWKGKMYADPAGGDTYEAMVWSNVGKPTQGDKFGQVGVTTAATGYEYGLDANGFLIESVTEGTASRVDSSSFDQSAGVKSFKLGTNRQYVSITGTYHGVTGEYRCTPGGNSTCAARVADQGFNLGGITGDNNAFSSDNGTWIFKPANPENRVMSAQDAAYASYGWWIKKGTDGKYTASAFTDNKGTAPTALEISELRGTATYRGGAAGKYALYSTTGGTNDAGHFTARATLTATFAEDHKIEGTIDNFTGADGMSRNWSVTLNETDVSDTGIIDGVGGESNNVEVMTVWTIGETAADKSGQWRGNLQEAGDDGVPAVATGTFYSAFGNDGKMVGAFGANKQ